ncbi:MAG TPA: tetratricopeptide repeat protein [Longimicrobiales bacterium]|nr:tetratricopeptide repeat protein [Longimicrobiales bacterium]
MLLRALPMLLALSIIPATAAAQVSEMAAETPPAEALWLLAPGDVNDEARSALLAGQHALDMGRAVEAHDHFVRAVQADPASAFAHLSAANTAPSLEAFLTHLRHAEERADQASEPVRLLIESARMGLTNDTQGQLALARRLTELEPGNPRSWMQLAGAQSTVNDEAAARASLDRAIEAAPGFAPAYFQLVNSYMLSEPRDLARAETNARRGVELAPEESIVHDLLGDVFRAQDRLVDAGAAYTRAAELGSENGLAYQQRGHVNSFLGNYDQARADYDAAIEQADPNAATTFAVYRALVSVHAGEPQAAVDELNALVGRIDGLDVPNATGNKLFALNTAGLIASHNGLFDEAESANERWAELARAQAEQIGTEENTAATESQIAFIDGMLAARRGDFDAAREKAHESMTLVEGQRNPLRDQPAHELLGLVALLQEDYEAAVAEYEQTSPNNLYASYHHALALEGLGRADEAREIFARVAGTNFNDPGLAIVKKDARRKAS